MYEVNNNKVPSICLHPQRTKSLFPGITETFSFLVEVSAFTKSFPVLIVRGVLLDRTRTMSGVILL